MLVLLSNVGPALPTLDKSTEMLTIALVTHQLPHQVINTNGAKLNRTRSRESLACQERGDLGHGIPKRGFVVG